MIDQSSLFPDTPQERTVQLDAQIADLVCGRRGGVLDLPLDDSDRAVLKCIRYRRGAANAISLRKIAETTKLDARSIKQAVRTLRLNYRLPIGSSKSGTDGGYFLMVTDDDRKIWRSDVIDQVRAQLAVLHAADGRQAALEALGQLRVEIEQEGCGR